MAEIVSFRKINWRRTLESMQVGEKLEMQGFYTLNLARVNAAKFRKLGLGTWEAIPNSEKSARFTITRTS